MSHHQANQIKKKLIPFMTLLLAVACMGLLASCGGGGGGSIAAINGNSLLTGTSGTNMEPYQPGNSITLSSGKTVVKNEILATKKESVSDDEASRYLLSIGLEIIGFNQYAGLYQLKTSKITEEEQQKIINEIEGSGLFDIAEWNYLSTFDAVVKNIYNDPKLSEASFSWWLDDINLGQSIKLLPNNSEKVLVGVADQAFRSDHNELKFQKIFQSNGREITYSSCGGKNFFGNYDCGSNFDHGMFVSGIIGSIQNNNTLGSGVAGDRALLYAAEATSKTDQISAITILLKQGVRVINISLNDRLCEKRENCTVYESDIKDFKKRVAAKALALYNVKRILDPENNVLLVSSAGNMGRFFLESPIGSFPKQPADFNGGISSFVSTYMSDVIDEKIRQYFLSNSLIVGAHDINRNVAAFSSAKISQSNYEKIFVSAPGVDISSAKYDGGSESHKMDTGTSFSTPIVTGVAALALQINPKLNAHELQTIIVDSVDVVGSTRFVNAEKAVQAALATLPQPPIITSPLYDRYTGATGEACYSRQIGTQKSAGVYTLSNSQYCRSGGQWVNVTGADNERYLDNQGNLYPFSAVEIKDTGNNTYTAGYGGSTIWNISYTQKSAGTYSQTVRAVSDHYSVDFDPNSYIYNNVEEFAILLYRYNTSSTNTGYLSSGGTVGFLFEGPSTTSGSVKYFSISDPNRSAINTGAWTRKAMGANTEIIELDEKSTLLNSYPDSSLRKIYYRGSSAGVREGNKTLAGRVDSGDLLDRNTINAIFAREGLPATPN
jgi:hypothetical protein